MSPVALRPSRLSLCAFFTLATGIEDQFMFGPGRQPITNFDQTGIF